MKYLSILLACISVTFNCWCSIIESNHIEEIAKYVDNETMVLVDLDNCLYQSTQALGHSDNFTDLFEQNLSKGMSKEEAIKKVYKTWVKIQKICNVQPVDKKFIKLLKSFQKKNIMVIGLTNRHPCIASATAKQVKSLNFDFNKTAPKIKNFSFDFEHLPLYRYGIIFVSDYNKKVDVLMQFLKHNNLHPKKIVFIDDKFKNVEEFEISKLEAEYLGVHYTAIKSAKKIYYSDLAGVQLRYLLKNKNCKKILSNKEALKWISSKL